MLGVLAALLAGVLVLFGFGQALGARGHAQRAADLAAVSAAQVMRRNFARLFEPAAARGRRSEPAPPVERRLPRARQSGRAARRRVATASQRRRSRGDVPATPLRAHPRDGRRSRHRRRAAARRAAASGRGARAGHGRDRRRRRRPRHARRGQRRRLLRPARLPAGQADAPRRRRAPSTAWPPRRAREAGLALLVTSGYRSDAEQAELFAAHPDPKWVAPPGQSLHRYGTELDLGPPAAYAWLAANARRFGFVKRYAWEPWHFGYTLNPGSTSVGFGGSAAAAPCRPSSRPPTATRSPAPPSAGTWGRRCWRRSSTSSRASTRSRAAPPARRGSPSSCPAPRPRSG